MKLLLDDGNEHISEHSAPDLCLAHVHASPQIGIQTMDTHESLETLSVMGLQAFDCQ